MPAVRNIGPRTALAAATALGVGAALLAGVAPTAASAAPGAAQGAAAVTAADRGPTVRVSIPVRRVEAAKYGKRVYYDLGAYVEAVGEAFEIRIRRPGYRVLTAMQSAHDGVTDDADVARRVLCVLAP